MVLNTMSREYVELSREYVGDMSVEAYMSLRIERNYSSASALLLTPPKTEQSRRAREYEALCLQECFPKHIRRLKRRISDTLEASTADTSVGMSSGAACRGRSQDTSPAETVVSPLRPSPGSSVGGTVDSEAGEGGASDVAALDVDPVTRTPSPAPRSLSCDGAPPSPDPSVDASEIDVARERAKMSADGGELTKMMATPALFRK